MRFLNTSEFAGIVGGENIESMNITITSTYTTDGNATASDPSDIFGVNGTEVAMSSEVATV